MNEIKQYVEIVPSLNYEPVTDEIWQGIEFEGLDEEAHNFEGQFDRDCWYYAELPITDVDENGLMNENEEQLEKFNQFDILLKNTYQMEYIDLIDYKNGKVYIVCCD